MLSCRDVTTLLARDELSTAPLRRRLGVRLHLYMCEHCRRFSREITAIGSAMRGATRDDDLAARAERIADRLGEEIARLGGPGSDGTGPAGRPDGSGGSDQAQDL